MRTKSEQRSADIMAAVCHAVLDGTTTTDTANAYLRTWHLPELAGTETTLAVDLFQTFDDLPDRTGGLVEFIVETLPASDRHRERLAGTPTVTPAARTAPDRTNGTTGSVLGGFYGRR